MSKKPDAQVVGLNTLFLSGAVPQASRNMPIRPMQKRVFTDDQWVFLQTRTDEDLRARIDKGNMLIAILHRPEMMNMVPKEANRISSNLRYQQDAIRSILKSRVRLDKE